MAVRWRYCCGSGGVGCFTLGQLQKPPVADFVHVVRAAAAQRRQRRISQPSSIDQPGCNQLFRIDMIELFQGLQIFGNYLATLLHNPMPGSGFAAAAKADRRLGGTPIAKWHLLHQGRPRQAGRGC
jgi:hypothetical protein